MAPPTEAIAKLLEETEAAHGAYETAELNGVYDQDWAQWYASYAVGHGLGDLLGRPADANSVAAVLSEGFAAFEREDPRPTKGWAAYLAERIATELQAPLDR
jgi:hypothetical protein